MPTHTRIVVPRRLVHTYCENFEPFAHDICGNGANENVTFKGALPALFVKVSGVEMSHAVAVVHRGNRN